MPEELEEVEEAAEEAIQEEIEELCCLKLSEDKNESSCCC